jgi:hypothetical protein
VYESHTVEKILNALLGCGAVEVFVPESEFAGFIRFKPRPNRIATRSAGDNGAFGPEIEIEAAVAVPANLVFTEVSRRFAQRVVTVDVDAVFVFEGVGEDFADSLSITTGFQIFSVNSADARNFVSTTGGEEGEGG